MTAKSDHLAESFDVQEHPIATAYHFVCCRSCKLRWFLPKDATRRTADALDVLADHASSHERADDGPNPNRIMMGESGAAAVMSSGGLKNPDDLMKKTPINPAKDMTDATRI